MACCWSETQLTEHQFLQALHNDDMWEAADGGVTEAIKDASDFLAIRSQTHVVLLQEGYHRLQAAALDRQLPPELRAAAQAGFTGYPPPAQLYWQPSRNLLHPLQLLLRELTGCAAACRPTQPMKCPLAHLEQVPFAVTERCKLLEVQYLMKELHQHQVPVHAQHDVDAQQPQQVQQQQAQPQQPLPEHQQVWGAAGDGIIAQQPPLCRRLSIRVVLQRLPAAPLPDEQQQDAAAEGSSWQHRGLQGLGQVQQVSYTCALEYPAHTLRSADYIISAHLFDRGISNWQALQNGDAFTMLWDGVPWRGFALSYRQRKPGDPFVGSPWYSIAVEWEGHSRDPKKDPEDWLYGNPWEMTREGSAGPPQLPDLPTAIATASKAGHPVLAAPWTTIGRAVAEQAGRRAPAKRKRQGQHHHDDDFVYDDSLDQEEAAAAAGHDADAWDPTTDFYYDDDPEEYELDMNHDHLQPRRKSARRHTNTGRRRASNRRGSPSPSFDGAGCSGRAHKAAAASAPGELTHNYGRELLARTDVCVVCGSKEGSLMSGHTGRGSACARQYHAGCLLLLNAAGIRTVMLGKSGAQQQCKHTSARSSSRNDAVGLVAASAQAQQLCDGLLGLLLQQSQQADCQLSAPVLAALAAAQAAAVRVASGELVLICPSHGCHGCRLNGKLEFMVWCCCCWIRVYHHRQCVPMGAEHVQLEGRDFIRCPHCRAAGVPVPGTAAAAAAAAAAGLQPTAGDAICGGAGTPDASAAAAADVAGLLVAAGMSDCSLAGSDGAMVTPAPQGTAGVDAAAGDQPADQQAPESEVTLGLGPTAAAADVMDIDQQESGVMHQSDKQQPLHQQQPESSEDTLQDPLLPVSASASAAAPAADQQQLAYAAAGQQKPEVVDLLDSELEGHEEGAVIITIDSSDDAEHEHAEQAQDQTPEQQQEVAQVAQQHLEQQLQQQQRFAVEPEQQEEQQQVAGVEGTRAGEEAAAEAVHMAAAGAAAEDDVDMDVLSAVADIDAQLQALQQQVQHIAQTSQTLQQQERGGSVTPSAAAAIAAPAEQGVAAALAALAAAAQAADHPHGPLMPAWLQLSLEDRERHSPSYLLVPCAATDGASSSRGSNSGVGQTTRALAAAAAATRTLPPAPETDSSAADDAAAPAAAGDVDGLGLLLAAAGADDSAGVGGFNGLPLTSPQSHLLIGCIEKAEKQYKPANVWGCAMIGVPQYPDDSSPYGLAIVLDYLPALQQQRQQSNAQGTAQVQGAAGTAAAGQSSAGQAARVRPRVFLKCSKAVAQSGRLQPAMSTGTDGERQGSREWQVLVNGAPYPQRQGRNGVALRVGDVITVQGLHLKLQLLQ